MYKYKYYYKIIEKIVIYKLKFIKCIFICIKILIKFIELYLYKFNIIKNK